MIVSRQSSIFEATLLKFSFKLHQIFDFRAHTHSGFHHHPGCHCPPNSTGTPPTHLLALCHPHQPPPSQIFVVSPVKTRTPSQIFRKFSTFDFLCTGPAPTTPAPPAHSAQALAPPAHPSA